MENFVLNYSVFAHPAKLYGKEMAKEFFGTSAKNAFVQVGETANIATNPLEAIKEKRKLRLHLERRDEVNGRCELWLKYWQSRYNFTGVWQPLPSQPFVACGQFSNATSVGKKHVSENALKPFASAGLLMRFNAHPERATAFELLVIQNARDYVKTGGIRALGLGDLEDAICDLRYALKPSFDYGICLTELLKKVNLDDSCLPSGASNYGAANLAA